MSPAPNEKPAAPVRTGATGDNQSRVKSSRQDGDCKANFGAHIHLQPAAEDCARVIIATAMKYGFVGPLASLTNEDFPTREFVEIMPFVREAIDAGSDSFSDIVALILATDLEDFRKETLNRIVGECAVTEPVETEAVLVKVIDKLRSFIEARDAQYAEWKAGAPDTEPAERFFYDGLRYFLDTGSEFVPLDQRSVVRHCRGWGVTPADIDPLLCQVQTERFVSFAGPLAGHRRGIHTAGGQRLLATSSPVIIKPRAGEWDTLRAVVENLLVDPDGGRVQVDTFLAWLKFARESLVTGRRRPGQALALAGPRGCGKSLLIDILALALGNRRANPYQYFTGRTHFNADLAGAELLAVDDEAGSTDIRSRKTLAASIKSCLFSGAVRIEAKNKCAFTFRPCWRMVLALNDEAENLLVLPPLAEDIADKLTLLKCHKRPLPMPAFTMDERDRFFDTLRREIPAMLAWLELWEIPGSLAEERCGVAAYHHPDLLAALSELSPEGQLLVLIDTASNAGTFPLPWSGSAAELKAILAGTPATSKDAEKLLGGWVSACGAYLAKLEHSGRVIRLPLRDGVTRWRISKSGPVD